jgi:hypothetical protein
MSPRRSNRHGPTALRPVGNAGSPPRAESGVARDADRILGLEEASLLDVVDNVLNKGVVVSGDLTIALAQVDLIYARLSLLLCAADRILPSEDADALSRRHRRASRVRTAAGR